MRKISPSTTALNYGKPLWRPGVNAILSTSQTANGLKPLKKGVVPLS